MSKLLTACLIVLASLSGLHAQTISVTSPVSTDTWVFGSFQTISWTYSGITTGNFEIYFSKNGVFSPGKLLATVACDASGSQSWAWNPVDSDPPNGVVASTNAKIKIVSTSTLVSGLSPAFTMAWGTTLYETFPAGSSTYSWRDKANGTGIPWANFEVASDVPAIAGGSTGSNTLHLTGATNSSGPDFISLVSSITYDFTTYKSWAFWMGMKTDINGNNTNSSSFPTFVLWATHNDFNTFTSTGRYAYYITWEQVSGNNEYLRFYRLVNGSVSAGYPVDVALLSSKGNPYADVGVSVRVEMTPLVGNQAKWEFWMAPAATLNGGGTTPHDDPWTSSSTLRLTHTENVPSAIYANGLNGYLGVKSAYNPPRKAAQYFDQIYYNNGAAVPVELVSFRALRLGDAVKLSWTTATEKNNYGFNVERSFDRENWETIGFVEGHGTVNTPQEYSFTDRIRFDGLDVVHYRLLQMDRDGSTTHSQIASVVLEPTDVVILKNFPNPFNPSTNISFNLKSDDVVTLTVYNSLGREVARLLSNTPMQAGYHTEVFIGSGLPSGVYSYQLQTSGGIYTNKMILSK